MLAAVGAQADDLGVKAYAVGGVVRDSLLSRPTAEIDFVTVGEGSGIALAQAMAESQGGRMSHVYKNFGTAGVWMSGPDDRILLTPEYRSTNPEVLRKREESVRDLLAHPAISCLASTLRPVVELHRFVRGS